MGQRLGTPISGNLINCTGYVVTISGITGLGTNVAGFLGNALPSAVVTFLGTPSSANLRSALTDETGTDAAVFATSPTITTPNIVGTATNNNAAAGSVGEIIAATSSAVGLVSTTPANLTSIALTAGDWDISAGFVATGGATTNMTDLWVSINTVTATNTFTQGQSYRMRGFTQVDPATASPVGVLRASLSGTTTYYLNAQSVFTGTAVSVTGIIRARRVR